MMSLWPLSSNLPSQVNGSDTHRKEDPENYHNSRDDISG
jgi:hypothetical protein